jgi:hypothetical protein
MYVNEKMRPVETIPGMGGGRMKENYKRGKFNYGILQDLFKISQCTFSTAII